MIPEPYTQSTLLPTIVHAASRSVLSWHPNTEFPTVQTCCQKQSAQELNRPVAAAVALAHLGLDEGKAWAYEIDSRPMAKTSRSNAVVSADRSRVTDWYQPLPMNFLYKEEGTCLIYQRSIVQRRSVSRSIPLAPFRWHNYRIGFGACRQF